MHQRPISDMICRISSVGTIPPTDLMSQSLNGTIQLQTAKDLFLSFVVTLPLGCHGRGT
jgi:hypothetical protein